MLNIIKRRLYQMKPRFFGPNKRQEVFGTTFLHVPEICPAGSSWPGVILCVDHTQHLKM